MRKGQDKLIKDNCYDPDSRIVDFRQKNRLANLEVTFGTRSLWRIFMPSWRKLPTDGVDWENWINAENEHNKIMMRLRRTE
jgi:hypothetical protein